MSLFPCVLALLALTATTTKQNVRRAALQDGHLRAAGTSIHQDADLQQVLSLLSMRLPGVQNHQTPVAQQESKSDAAKIARMVKLNRKKGLRNLLHQMFVQGGAQRVSNAMLPLANLGYRREDVYSWLTGSPPVPHTEVSVKLGDDENPLEQARPKNSRTLEDAEREPAGEDSLAFEKPSQQPEVSGPEGLHEESYAAVDPAQPLKQSEEQLAPPDNLAVADAAPREDIQPSAEAEAPREVSAGAEAARRAAEQLARADAVQLLKYVKARDSAGLSSVYEMMIKHGGEERVNTADAMVEKLQNADPEPKVDQKAQGTKIKHGGDERVNTANANAEKMLKAPPVPKVDQKDQGTKIKDGGEERVNTANANAEKMLKTLPVPKVDQKDQGTKIKDGGKERVNKADAIAEKMRKADPEPKVDQQAHGTKISLAKQAAGATADLATTAAPQAAGFEQADADAHILVVFMDSSNTEALGKFYETMRLHGGLTRVREAEAAAKKLQTAKKDQEDQLSAETKVDQQAHGTKISLSRQAAGATADLATAAAPQAAGSEQADADAHILAAFMASSNTEALGRFYETMKQHGGLTRVREAESAAIKLQTAKKSQEDQLSAKTATSGAVGKTSSVAEPQQAHADAAATVKPHGEDAVKKAKATAEKMPATLHESQMDQKAQEEIAKAAAATVNLAKAATVSKQASADAKDQMKNAKVNEKTQAADPKPQADQKASKDSEKSSMLAKLQQAYADAHMLVAFMDSSDSDGLRGFYDMMTKHGGMGRVREAETLAKKMRAAETA